LSREVFQAQFCVASDDNPAVKLTDDVRVSLACLLATVQPLYDHLGPNREFGQSTRDHDADIAYF
jgi:hypothetical protein